jgi:hypothetical protein
MPGGGGDGVDGVYFRRNVVMSLLSESETSAR